MNFTDYYNHYTSREDSLTSSFPAKAYIQWKGTDVCMDAHCICGHHMHFDTTFLYYIRCPQCRALYAVGQNVVLLPLTGEYKEYVEKQDSCVHVGREEIPILLNKKP